MRAWLMARLSALLGAGNEEPEAPLDDGLLSFSCTEDCAVAIDCFGRIDSKPFARTSKINFPKKVVAGMKLCCESIFSDPSGDPLPDKTGSLGTIQIAFFAETSVIGQHATNVTLDSHIEPDCSVLQADAPTAAGKYTVSATIHSQHLVGSPAVLEVVEPPWKLNSDSMTPAKSHFGRTIKFGQNYLTASITKKDVEAAGLTYPQAQGCYMYIYSDKPIRYSPSTTWMVRFEEVKANASKKATDSGQAEGSAQPHGWIVGIASSTGGDQGGHGYYNGRDFQHPTNVCYGQYFVSDGSISGNNYSHYPNRPGVRDIGLPWHSGDVLRITLDAEQRMLTIHNTASNAQGQVGCGSLHQFYPVFGLALEGHGSKVSIGFEV